MYTVAPDRKRASIWLSALTRAMDDRLLSPVSMNQERSAVPYAAMQRRSLDRVASAMASAHSRASDHSYTTTARPCGSMKSYYSINSRRSECGTPCKHARRVAHARGVATLSKDRPTHTCGLCVCGPPPQRWVGGATPTPLSHRTRHPPRRPPRHPSRGGASSWTPGCASSARPARPPAPF